MCAHEENVDYMMTMPKKQMKTSSHEGSLLVKKISRKLQSHFSFQEYKVTLEACNE